MKRKLLFLVAGARPNFMKIAPTVRALDAHGGLDYRIIHTGQHYDREMNGVFFDELGIPAPDVFMGAGGGSHAQQTSKIMMAFEELCQATPPDAVLVVGDVMRIPGRRALALCPDRHEYIQERQNQKYRPGK